MDKLKSILFVVFVILSSTFINSCTKDNDDPIDEPFEFEVGVAYQGGIIVYILNSSDVGYDANEPHGLIASATDIGNEALWNNDVNILTNATGVDYGTGETNTQLIVEAQGIGSYAAKVCSDLVIDDYDDWYLPSKVELSILYMNRDSLGVFSSEYYWSSSEFDIDRAYCQHFDYGTQIHSPKDSYFLPVRAVRNF